MIKTASSYFARILFVFAIILLNTTSFVSVANAAGAAVPGCSCFCQTTEGAKPTDPSFQIKTTPEKCLAECKKTNATNGAVCAFNIDQYPERGLQCFTKAQCVAPYTGEDANKKGKPIGIFGPQGQVPECPSGMHYCYPNPELAGPLILNVAIGPLKQAIDVGEYINAIYYWMIGAGITIAIVMIMIGGLQYVLGAGGGSAAKTAKKRIGDAVIGLVLLLCVNLILSTVNPYLIRLQVPKLPMLKTVALLQGNPSCETLLEKYNLTDTEGKSLNASGKKCGDSAVVKDAKDGTTVVAGTTCDFRSCPDKEAGCLGSGIKAKCMKCKDVTYENKAQPPSSDVCHALKIADDPSKNVKNFCFYSHDPSVVITAKAEIFGGGAALIGAAVSGPFALVAAGALTANYADNLRVGTCAEIHMNCNNITSCDNYDNQVRADSSIVGDDIEGFFNNPLWGEMNLKTVCESNPCNVKFKNTDGSIVDSVPQTKVCGMKIGNDYSLWDKLKNDCVQKGELEIVEGGKVEKSGSCDPAKCAVPKQCTEDVGGNKACVECGDVVNGNELAGGNTLQPSDVICSGLSAPSQGVKGTAGYKNQRCRTTSDSNMLVNTGKGNNTCALFKIDCSVVKVCKDYDTEVEVFNSNKPGGIGLEYVTGKNGFESICAENPCGVEKPKGCEMSYTKNDCVSK